MAGTCVVASRLPIHIFEVGNKALDGLRSSQFASSGKVAVQRRHKNLGRQLQTRASSNQRHVVITGGNTGIGKATAISLARQGMSVTIACRDMVKGEQAVAEINRESNSSPARVLQLDLASFASIRLFAAEYLDLGIPLDCLVNNAGVMACPLQYTLDGFEYQLGNQVKSGGLGLICERIGGLDLNDLNFKTRKYNEWQAYGQSKLANCLFSHELSRRCTSLGLSVTSNCMHPGIVDTELSRYILPQFITTRLPTIPGLRPIVTKLLGLKTPEEGASTAVYLASSCDMEGITGGYY